MDAQEKKLRQSIWIIIGVGIFLTIALAVGLVTQVVNKQRARIAQVKNEYQTQKSRADALPKTMVERQKAQDNLEYVGGQIKFFQQRYRSLPFDSFAPTNPAIPEASRAAVGLNNKNTAWRRWMNEYASGYGLALRRELLSISGETGVILKTSIKVGDPPKVPEEVVVPTNGLFRPTGGPLQITVTGALSNIMQFLNRINQSSILMLVNNDIKISGYSPDTTATFTVVPYLLASGDVTITSGAPAAGAAGAPAAGVPGEPGSSGAYPGSSSGPTTSASPSPGSAQ